MQTVRAKIRTIRADLRPVWSKLRTVRAEIQRVQSPLRTVRVYIRTIRIYIGSVQSLLQRVPTLLGTSLSLIRATWSSKLSLSPTEGLTLAVILPSGQAPERIRAGVLDASGKTVAAGYYPVGENGRVRLSNVPPGSWQIFVDSDFSAPASVPATVPGPVVSVALPPAGMVRVKVPALTRDDTTATVSLTGPGGAYRTFDYTGQVASQWDLYRGIQSFGRIPAGTWQVTAKTADGRTFTGSTAVTPGGVVDVTLQ